MRGIGWVLSVATIGVIACGRSELEPSPVPSNGGGGTGGAVGGASTPSVGGSSDGLAASMGGLTNGGHAEAGRAGVPTVAGSPDTLGGASGAAGAGPTFCGDIVCAVGTTCEPAWFEAARSFPVGEQPIA